MNPGYLITSALPGGTYACPPVKQSPEQLSGEDVELIPAF